MPGIRSLSTSTLFSLTAAALPDLVTFSIFVFEKKERAVATVVKKMVCQIKHFYSP
jgi:hypothetical protein